MPPSNLNKTPSANVAVAMANLDRLTDTPECQGVRTSVRAHLIAAMGQTTTLLKRAQVVPYTEATSVDAKLICKHKGLILDSNVKACQPI